MTEPIFTPEDELFLMWQAAQVRAGMLEPGPAWPSPRAGDRYIIGVDHAAPGCDRTIAWDARQPPETLLRESPRDMADVPQCLVEGAVIGMLIVLCFLLGFYAAWAH